MRQILRVLQIAALRIRSWSWIVGVRLTPRTNPDEVSDFISRRRRYHSDPLQWWHPSLSASIAINLIVICVDWYRHHYYWPVRLAASSKREGIVFQKACQFHFARNLLLVVFFCLVYFRYMDPGVSFTGSARSLGQLAWLLVYTGPFLLLILDNVLSQWADLATFLQCENITAISVLLCRRSFRDHLWRLRDRLIVRKSLSHPEIQIRLKEQVEEVIKGKVYIKGDVFRLAVLPLRHPLRLIVIWALMILALQLHFRGKAFSNLCLHKNRTVGTFLVDAVDCLYFSTITVTTIGFGDVSPNVAEDSDKLKKQGRADFTILGPVGTTDIVRGFTSLAAVMILITILATFNLAFRIVGEVMEILSDPQRLSDAIQDFMTDDHLCPILR